MKRSLTYMTTVKRSLTFSTKVKRSLLYSTIVKRSLTYRTTVKRSLTCSTIVKRSLMYSTLIKQLKHFLCRYLMLTNKVVFHIYFHNWKAKYIVFTCLAKGPKNNNLRSLTKQSHFTDLWEGGGNYLSLFLPHSSWDLTTLPWCWGYWPDRAEELCKEDNNIV